MNWETLEQSLQTTLSFKSDGKIKGLDEHMSSKCDNKWREKSCRAGRTGFSRAIYISSLNSELQTKTWVIPPISCNQEHEQIIQHTLMET